LLLPSIANASALVVGYWRFHDGIVDAATKERL
jgi:hypothetical protein